MCDVPMMERGTRRKARMVPYDRRREYVFFRSNAIVARAVEVCFLAGCRDDDDADDRDDDESAVRRV